MSKAGYAILLLTFLLIMPASFATWDDYEGVTSWRVQVIEDERGCGGGVKRDEYRFSIRHNRKVAQVMEPVHGSAVGTFYEDALHIPGRTIPDGQGTSRLFAFAASFTCTSMHAKYGWDYKDKYMSCSGTTEWRGTRLDGKECPGTQARPQDIGTELEEMRGEEARYKAALAKDPKNFWANWDIAEYKKKQGNYKDYFTYLNKAMANEKIFAETRRELKENARKKLGLSKYPAPATVPILRTAQKEMEMGGVVHNIQFQPPHKSIMDKWYTALWAAIVPDSNKILKELAGIGEEQ